MPTKSIVIFAIVAIVFALHQTVEGKYKNAYFIMTQGSEYAHERGGMPPSCIQECLSKKNCIYAVYNYRESVCKYVYKERIIYGKRNEVWKKVMA